MQRIVLVVLVVAVLLAGCQSLEHLADWDQHAWHSYPALAGGWVTAIVTLPIVVIVGVIRGDLFSSDSESWRKWGFWPGAILVGGPFYLLGLPFEGGEPDQGADSQGPSDEVLKERDEVIEDAQRGDR